ncbi:MAG: hypothetical protein M5U26_22970 [Planctomycetota bacterium]|nr:hypothetical protein [Planctomycetota bacterium]
MNKRRLSAFTLVEVIVALGIAATALILLVSANHESLRRSLRAGEGLRLGLALESKLDEIRLGLEQSGTGPFEGLPGYSWRLERRRETSVALKGLERLTLAALDRQDRTLMSLETLVWTPPAPTTEEPRDAPR